MTVPQASIPLCVLSIVCSVQQVVHLYKTMGILCCVVIYNLLICPYLCLQCVHCLLQEPIVRILECLSLSPVLLVCLPHLDRLSAIAVIVTPHCVGVLWPLGGTSQSTDPINTSPVDRELTKTQERSWLVRSVQQVSVYW